MNIVNERLAKFTLLQSAGVLALIASGLVLAGWIFDVALLRSLLPGGVAVKANTAVAFALIGFALQLLHFRGLRFGRLLVAICGLLVATIGFVTLIEYCLGWASGIDEWLFREVTYSASTSHPGRMAPDTALSCLLLGLVIGAKGAPPTRWISVISVVCESFVGSLALAAILAAITPSLRTQGWWGLTIMAPATAGLFAILSAALVRADWNQLPTRRKWLFAFTSLTLLLLTAGWWYYRAEAARLRHSKYEEIAAIGSLKAGQIQEWRNRRLNDAARMADGPLVRNAVAKLVRHPGEQIRADILERLHIERSAGGYADAFLLAADGTVLVATADPSAVTNPSTKQCIAAALSAREAVLSDLFRDQDGGIKIDAAATVRDVSGNPLAVAILRSDAATYLYPLIQTWPTGSHSGETFIAHREGDFVVFLNQARHQANTALTLRQPLARTEIPSVQAALGRRGIFEGRDYRGVAVLSDLRQIPGSDWFMVAKIDINEIFSETRTRTGLIAVVVGSFILLAGVGTASIYRQQNAEEIARLNSYNRSLLEASLDPLVTIGADGKISDVNLATENVTGRARNELIGSDFFNYFTDAEQARRGYEQTFRDSTLRDFALDLLHRDGRVTPVLCNASVYKTEDGEIGGVFAAARDISERKRAEVEIRRYAEDLKRSNRDLEQFAYVASHDLQEPLRTVSSFSQLLAKRYQGRLDADADEFINFISSGAARMQTLINDLLLFSRVGSRGQEFEPVDADESLHTAMGNLKAAVAESSAIITHDRLPKLYADGSQLTQFFQNLIGNAIKFHRPSHSPQIHVSAGRFDHSWLFSVKDNGIGIDPKYFDRIFVIFQRLHGREEYAGTGIGLAICKKIIERHGGKIWVESEPGTGSNFKFTIPDRGVNS